MVCVVGCYIEHVPTVTFLLGLEPDTYSIKQP